MSVSVLSFSLSSDARVRRVFWLVGAGLLVAVAAILLIPGHASAQLPPTSPPAPAASNCNYNINNNAAYSWDGLSPGEGGTGTGLAHGDYSTFPITPNPSFQFNLCGQWYNDYVMVSKGFMCFGADVPCTTCCPYAPYSGGLSPGNPNLGHPAVYAHYADIYPGGCPGGGASCVFWQVLGNAPNRRLVYEFYQVPWYYASNTWGPLTFEIRLFEASQCVEVDYQSVSGGNGSPTLAGFQDGAGAAGWQYYFSSGSGFPAGQTNKAWRACPVTPPGPPPPPPPPPQPYCGYTRQTTEDPVGSPLHYNYNWIEVAPSMGGGGTTIPNMQYYTAMAVQPGTGVTPGPPFALNFCGNSYQTFWLASTGHICMGPNNSAAPTGTMRYYWDNTPAPVPTNCGYGGPSAATLPSSATPNNAIYGFWAWLDPQECASSDCLSYKITGTSPNRVLIYEERNVPSYGTNYGWCSPACVPETFQIKLYEKDGCIAVDYQQVQSTSTTNWWNGVQSGFESATASVGYNYLTAPAYSFPGFLRAQQGWKACPVPPFDAKDDSYILNEDQAVQSLAVTANDVNNAPGGLTVTIDTPPTKGIALVSGNNILYTPLPDRVGPDSFVYRIENTEPKNDTGTVSITLNPVNDAPIFLPQTNLIVTTPGAGPQVVPGWATNVAEGPATATDEVPQGITFDLSLNTDGGIFIGVPTLERTTSATAIDPDQYNPLTLGGFGVLRFTPSGSFGNSDVCFRPHDDGGTAIATNTWGATVPGVNIGAPVCVTIIENGPPIAYFTTSEGTAPGQEITFNPCPTPVPLCSYDPNDAIAMWHWEFGDGDTSDAMMPIHSYANPGAYTVRLTVVDSFGMVGYTERLVVVAWPDGGPVAGDGLGGKDAPLANAGDNMTVLEGSHVKLNGTQKGGSEKVRFEWAQVRGLPTVTFDNKSLAAASFTAPMLDGVTPIDLVFSLRASEGAATSRFSFVTVHVVSGNVPPVADAGGPQSIAARGLVTLDGSHSRDADGDTLTYHWTQVYAPQDIVVSLKDADKATATFAAPGRTGILRFHLTVSDGNEEAVDEAIVVVQPAPAQAGGFTFTTTPSGKGADVRFEAAAKVTEANWDFGEGTTGVGSPTTHHFEPGTYTVTMVSGHGADIDTYAEEITVTTVTAQVGNASTAGFNLVPAIVGGGVLLAAIGAVVLFMVVRRRRAAQP